MYSVKRVSYVLIQVFFFFLLLLVDIIKFQKINKTKNTIFA